MERLMKPPYCYLCRFWWTKAWPTSTFIVLHHNFTVRVYTGYTEVRYSPPYNIMSSWHHRATDVWKLRLCCSCQYTHSICTLPIFLGCTTHDTLNCVLIIIICNNWSKRRQSLIKINLYRITIQKSYIKQKLDLN